MFKILLSVICFTSFAFSYAIENFGTQQTNTQSYDNFPQENFTPTANYTKQNTHPLYNARRNKLLGIYGAYNKATSDAKLNIEGAGEQSHDLDEKQYALGIQAGYLLSPLHRILANYEYNFKKNGFSYQIFTLGYAFTPQIPNTQNWRLLLGANAGLALGKFDSGSFVINDSAMGGLSYTGYTFGLKAGAIYETLGGELEFGMQARRLNFGEESSSVDIGGTPTNAKLNLSKTSTLGAYIGYNFLF